MVANVGGFAPYQIQLTATQIDAAIQAGHNLGTTLRGYVAEHGGSIPPTVQQGVVDGDLWSDPATGKRYRAYVDVLNVVYFEL